MALTHFYAAQDAMKHVRDVAGVKASNRPGDGASQEAFDRADEWVRRYGDHLAEQQGCPPESMIDLCAWAGAAEKFGVGNCEAMASLAFAYLAKKGHRPLAIIGFYSDKMYWYGPTRQVDRLDRLEVRLSITGKPIPLATKKKVLKEGRTGRGGNDDYEQVDAFEVDHVVCVVGPMADPTDYRTWDEDTVVCDPWARRCYFAHELPNESRLIARVTGGVTTTSIRVQLKQGDAWNNAWVNKDWQ